MEEEKLMKNLRKNELELKMQIQLKIDEENQRGEQNQRWRKIYLGSPNESKEGKDSLAERILEEKIQKPKRISEQKDEKMRKTFREIKERENMK